MTIRRVRAVVVGAILPALAFVASAGGASPPKFRGFCTETAFALHEACYADFIAGRAVRKGVCLNISDSEARHECWVERDQQRDEDKELCDDQKLTRLAACRLLGEGRYDPAFEPELFDDPRSPTKPNPFYPLNVGYKWEYRGGGGGHEVDTVEVVNETKLLESGVRCIVVKDTVLTDGFVTEATDDWFAAAKDGTTWYCGENTAEFETFEGDDPKLAELVNIDGSFKAGREGDKAGIIFLAHPKVGDVYLEEFSLANAEDVTEILSTTYEFGKDADLDERVPQDLVSRFCKGDCVVTKNYSLLEPGIFAHKIYAPDVGVIVEVEFDETGDVVRLSDCSFDPRCVNLPQP